MADEPQAPAENVVRDFLARWAEVSMDAAMAAAFFEAITPRHEEWQMCISAAAARDLMQTLLSQASPPAPELSHG